MRKFFNHLFLSLALLSQISLSQVIEHKDADINQIEDILLASPGYVVFLKVDQVEVGTTYKYQVATISEGVVELDYIYYKVNAANDSEIMMTTLVASHYDDPPIIENVSIYSKKTGFLIKRKTGLPGEWEEIQPVSSKDFEGWFQNYRLQEDYNLVDSLGGITKVRRVRYLYLGQANNEIFFSKDGSGLNSLYSKTEQGYDSDGNLVKVRTSLLNQYQEKNSLYVDNYYDEWLPKWFGDHF